MNALLPPRSRLTAPRLASHRASPRAKTGRLVCLTLVWLACAAGPLASQAQTGGKARASAAGPVAAAAPASSPEATGQGYQVHTEEPAWALPVRLSEVEPLPVAQASLQMLLLDTQVRAGADGSVHNYNHIIRRVQDRSGLEPGAQWQIVFDPSYQRLVLHKLVVWRDGQPINRLPGLKVQLLQRETQLERQMYDGRRTASIIQDDVRVGDRLELSYSLVGANPVFGKRFVDQDWSVAYKGPSAWVRYRLLTPTGKTVAVRAEERHHQITRSESGGWVSTLVERRNAPGPVWESAAPAVSYLEDMLFFSEFADWPAVANWADQLFAVATRAPLAPAVQAQAAQLRRANRTETATAVLDFVQNQIRYFGTEIGVNSHQPASPEQVLRQRFGDCKDKVALAVALLRALDITATPLLVSTHYRAAVAGLQPTPLAFNHAILTLELEGQSWVLDPTRSLQTGPLAERVSQGLGYGLPARAGAALVPLPDTREAILIDAQDTLSLPKGWDGTPQLLVEWTYHGEFAEMVRQYTTGEARQELVKQLVGEYSRMYGNARPVDALVVQEVPEHNQVLLRQRFDLPDHFKLQEDRWLRAELALPALTQALRLPDQTPRTRALQLAAPGHYRQGLSVVFDEDVFARPGVQRGSDGDHFTQVQWQQQTAPRVASIQADLLVSPDVVPAAQWQAHREALLKLWARVSTSLTVGTVPQSVADGLDQRLQQFSQDARQGRTTLRTAVQLRAVANLMRLNTQFAAKRLPTAAKVRLLTLRAGQFNLLGRYADAQSAITEALALQPDNQDALATAALTALGREQFDETVRLATQVLEVAPGTALMRMARGRAHYQTGRYAPALEDFRQAQADFSVGEQGYAQLWQLLTQRRLEASGAGGSSPAPAPLGTASGFGGNPFGSAGADTSATTARPTAAWPAPILQVLRGELPEAEARKLAQANAELALAQLCELYFYLGEAQRIAGEPRQALALMRQARDTGAVEMVEFGMAGRALTELSR